jgi:hypothetical protein
MNDDTWYVVTGDVNIANITKLWTKERCFIWRGFTEKYEMLPSAANYDLIGKKITNYRTEICHPLAEIERVAEKIYELNRLQKFPFEIPWFVRKVLFPKICQSENDLFSDDTTEFPDSSLAQAMALVQHEFGGTSLLDFSINRYKALYFAIGKGENFSKTSYLFGLNVSYFETHKHNFTEKVLSMDGKKFDLLYPSYFRNDKIAHQEGVFLYQKFSNFKSGYPISRYENIIKYFNGRFEEGKKKKYFTFQEITLDDFLKKLEEEGNKYTFYFLLDIPVKEKPALKAFLNDIGITDAFMMNEIREDTPKLEESFADGSGI